MVIPTNKQCKCISLLCALIENAVVYMKVHCSQIVMS